jgi:hypothetical protein
VTELLLKWNKNTTKINRHISDRYILLIENQFLDILYLIPQGREPLYLYSEVPADFTQLNCTRN